MKNVRFFTWTIGGIKDAIMRVSPKTVTVSYEGESYVVLASTLNTVLKDNDYNNAAPVEVRLYDKEYPDGHSLKCLDIKHF